MDSLEARSLARLLNRRPRFPQTRDCEATVFEQPKTTSKGSVPVWGPESLLLTPSRFPEDVVWTFVKVSVEQPRTVAPYLAAKPVRLG